MSALGLDDLEPALAPFHAAALGSNLLDGLVLSSKACVKLVDLSGRLIAMNPAGRVLMEIDDFDTVCNSDWASLWPAYERARISEGLRSAQQGQTTSFVAQCSTAKGNLKWWDVTILPIRDGGGGIQYVLSSSYDVTHLKEREQELERRLAERQSLLTKVTQQLSAETRRLADAHRQLRHGEKVRLFGQFVGGVVHDINNVLAVMSGASRLLRRRLSSSKDGDVLNHVDQAVDRGQKLVRQLLDFGRSDSGDAEVASVKSLLKADANLFRRLAGSNVGVELDIEGDDCSILVEPSKFQSVIFNLVANARDAMPGGGTVKIGARRVSADARPAGLPAGDYVMVAVRDSGQGMTPEVLARVGEPFFTTKGVGKGTGLGLASAFDLADRSGGRVIIDSSVGIGTTITLVLPIAAVAGDVVATPDAAIDPSLHGRATILVAEDDGLVRAHIAAVLKDLGYVVIEASSEEVALASFFDDRMIDLIVSDIHIGSGSGPRLVGRIRKDMPQIPVIFVTGSSGLTLPRDELVVKKPISEARLARAILEKLGRLPASHLSANAVERIERIREKVKSVKVREALSRWLIKSKEIGHLPCTEDAHDMISQIRDNAYLLQVLGDPELPTFRFLEAGKALEAQLGRPLSGETIALTDQDVIGTMSQAYKRCLGGTAYYDFARFRLGSGNQILFERLLMPLTDDGEKVTHLLGVATFDEITSNGKESQ